MVGLSLILAALATAPSAVAVEAGATTALGRHLCSVAGDDRVTLVEGRLLVPKDSAFARLRVTSGDCASPETLAVAVVPQVGRGGTIARIYVDENRLELRGGDLKRALVWWRAGTGVWTAAACVEATDGDDGTATCDAPLSREGVHSALSSGNLDVLRLPPGMPAPAAFEPPEVWPAEGGRTTSGPVALEALRAPMQRIVLSPPLWRTTSIEAWREQAVLPLEYPGVVTSVNCRPAGCWLSEDGASIIVATPSVGDSVTVGVRLRERVAMRQGDGLVGSTVVSVPMARCQLRPLTTMVLAGSEDFRLPVELGERCPTDLSDTATETTPPSASYLERREGDGKHLDVRLGHVPRRADSMELRLLRASTRAVIGTARLDVMASYVPSEVNLVDGELGELAVIPTNREVRLQWAGVDPRLAANIVPVALPGYYSLRHEGGDVLIRGATRSAGAVPLRFAFVVPAPAEGQQRAAEPLVAFESEAHFAVRQVNVPVSLAPDDQQTGRMFAVFCRNGTDGQEREIAAGELVTMPFAARGSCRLRIDRHSIDPSQGTQRIRVTVAITSPNGAPRGGGFSQVVVLATGTTLESVWLGASDTMRPFDHMSVQLSHDELPGHYQIEGQASGQPGRRYQMVFGDQHLRLYGSAAVPTGLYRVTSGAGAGVLQFSAGVLARLALLDREGKEFPLDLEFGLLGTNLSDRADLSVVAGLGVTVPLLNPQESTQAAIGVHAWAEYAPTRHGANTKPVAFIFGPSISLGDFGTNL